MGLISTFMSFAQIKMIVFDLDGTLVDSMTGFADVAQEVIAKYFAVPVSKAREAYRRTSGLPFVHQLQGLFPGHPSLTVAVEEYEARKIVHYDAVPFFADVAESLETLAAAGFLLAVSSNNHEHSVSRKLRRQGCHVDEVLGFREGFGKGRPHFEHLCRCYGLSPENLLFVGDSLHDARLAHENGVAFLARLGTFAAGDFEALKIPLQTLNTLAEINTLLGDARCKPSFLPRARAHA